jgi:ParB family chromosome partitioning protein
MSEMKPALGRGLDALIAPSHQNNSDQITVPARQIKTDNGTGYDILVKIPVGEITANPYQPRLEFNPEALDELKKSILENGLIQPITVRRAGDRFELISGERRLRACRDIGYKTIPAYIIKVDSNEAMLALALIENIQREKLNSIEIAQAYKRLLDECKLSQEEIAVKVGKDRSTITNTLRLLKLPAEVQDCLIHDKISAGHARALINLPNEKYQIDMMHKIVNDSLSVRKVENLVKKYLSAELPQHTSNNPAKKQPPVQNILQDDIEDKLRRLFGTKVSCKQKNDGSGEVVIEFYSPDELDRLFEMFEVIGKSYN